VLDGSERVDTILKMAMPWDVMSGVARRAWARNENALSTADEWNHQYSAEGDYRITMPYLADDAVLDNTLKKQAEAVEQLLQQIKSSYGEHK